TGSATRALTRFVLNLFSLPGFKLDNRLQNLERSSIHIGNTTPIDEQGWRTRNLYLSTQVYRCIDAALRVRFGGASGDVASFHSGAGGESRQFFIRIGFGDFGLRVVSCAHKFPECIVVGTSGTVRIRRCLRRPIVRWQGELLEDETRVGLFRQQLIDSGLRLLAMWALQIAELDDHYRRVGRAAGNSIDTLLQLFVSFGERLLAKWDQVADERVLAVLADIEGRILLTLLIGENNIDFRQALRDRRLDSHDFPIHAGVVSECLL